jgi:hypothetical protein
MHKRDRKKEEANETRVHEMYHKREKMRKVSASHVEFICVPKVEGGQKATW